MIPNPAFRVGKRKRVSIHTSFLRSRFAIFSLSLSFFRQSYRKSKIRVRESRDLQSTMNRHHDPNPFDEEEEEIVNPFSVTLFSESPLSIFSFIYLFSVRER